MFHVIFSPVTGTLYIGVANNVTARLELHRSGHGSEFVKQYGVHRLVYVETYSRAEDAIQREKQMKKWNRAWKIRLIEQDNPEWKDLSDMLN